MDEKKAQLNKLEDNSGVLQSKEVDHCKKLKEELEILLRIVKILNKNDNAPPVGAVEQMQHIVKGILSYSMTMQIEKIDNHKIELLLFDNIDKRLLAKLEFNMIGKTLTLMNYELY